MNVRTILSSIILLFTFALAAWAQDETIDLSEQGFTNGQLVEEVSGTGCKVEFARGANDRGVLPRYYDNGTAVRVYFGNTVSVSSTNDKDIVRIILIFGQAYHNEVSSDCGIYTPDTGMLEERIYTYGEDTWTGRTSAVTFSVGGKNGHCKLQKLVIHYATEVATPDISGVTPFDHATTVTITCPTEGAAIYYTTDGTTPSTESTLYENSFDIGETTTVSAIAVKDGQASDVSTKVFVNNAGLWTQGSGTATDPYLISNTAQLNQLATRVNDGETYKGIYFKQTANLTFDGTVNNFTPIGGYYGEEYRYFYGVYDGGGYSIGGININKTGTAETDNYQSVFGLISYGAVVKNLTITGSTFAGYLHVGGIAGYSEGRIENCHATSSVSIHSVVNGARYHGGIAGCNGSVIFYCSSAASIEVDGNFTTAEYNGGITGWNYKGSHTPYIYNSLYTGSLVQGTHYYGTIAGDNDYKATDCYYVKQANELEAIGGWNNSGDNQVANDVCAYTLSCNTEGVTLIFEGDAPNPDIIEMRGNLMAYGGVYYVPGDKSVTFSLAASFDCSAGNVTTTGGTLTSNADGSYTLVMPDADAAIEVSFSLALTDNGDNTTVLTTYDGVTADVTLEGRTLWKDGCWNTLCLPFSLSSLAGTPLEGATVKTLETSSFAHGTLTLNFTKDEENLTSIEAGVPYIVKWTSGNSITDPTFENVTISNTSRPVTTDEVSFAGLYSPLTVGEKKPVTYAVAKLDGTTLTFKMTDEAPDGVTSWDASNTPSVPGWNRFDSPTIKKVVFDSSFANARPKNCSSWFSNSNVSSITGMENFNTSEVTSMFNMFSHCYDLGSVDVSHFDTRKVTNMAQMFGGTGYWELDLSSFDTSNVENMTEMFGGSRPLVTIKVSDGWSLEKVTASASMFRDCDNLKGGAGTVFDANHVDAEYARIDGGTSNPGYLTQGTKPSYEPIGEEGDYSDRTVLYLGADNTLYYPSEAVTIGAFRAYFKLQGDLTAGEPFDEAQGIKAFVLNFGDEETGIRSISENSENSDNSEKNSFWYTLDGRRLNGKPSQRGIYIFKGIKTMIQ